jgi:hypothetical protein
MSGEREKIKAEVSAALARIGKDPDAQSAELVGQATDLAFAFIEWSGGDIETVRAMWQQAFEEAERISANQELE